MDSSCTPEKARKKLSSNPAIAQTTNFMDEFAQCENILLPAIRSSVFTTQKFCALKTQPLKTICVPTFSAWVHLDSPYHPLFDLIQLYPYGYEYTVLS